MIGKIVKPITDHVTFFDSGTCNAYAYIPDYVQFKTNNVGLVIDKQFKKLKILTQNGAIVWCNRYDVELIIKK